MYADIAVSKNLTDKFRQTETANALELDFRIKILTHGCWPLSKDISVNLPIELTKVTDRFTAFYHSQHSGRKLTWLFSLSKCELIMNGIKKRYHIKVSKLDFIKNDSGGDGGGANSHMLISNLFICRRILFKQLFYFNSMNKPYWPFNSFMSTPVLI